MGPIVSHTLAANHVRAHPLAIRRETIPLFTKLISIGITLFTAADDDID